MSVRVYISDMFITDITEFNTIRNQAQNCLLDTESLFLLDPSCN